MSKESNYRCREAGLDGFQIDSIARMDAKIELGYESVNVPPSLGAYGASDKTIISKFYKHASGCGRCRDLYEDSLAIARAIQEAPD